MLLQFAVESLIDVSSLLRKLEWLV